MFEVVAAAATLPPSLGGLPTPYHRQRQLVVLAVAVAVGPTRLRGPPPSYLVAAGMAAAGR